MMLHRHFEAGKADENITRLSDLNKTQSEAFVSEVVAPEQEQTERPKRGRKKKTETESE